MFLVQCVRKQPTISDKNRLASVWMVGQPGCMDILINCEFSGTIREEMRNRGHNCYSCDLLPAEDNSPFHIQGDAIEAAFSKKWDMMIAHPPCTYLTNAGVRWLHTRPGRWEEMEQACDFFRKLLEAPIEQVAVENPIPHKYALALIGCKYDQIVQPWMFGHKETKATCLWLRGLPPLKPTNNVRAETMALPAGERGRVWSMGPSPDRWKERSRTLPGLARAIAEQWG